VKPLVLKLPALEPLAGRARVRARALALVASSALLLAPLLAAAESAQEIQAKAQEVFAPLPEPPVASDDNPVTEEKVELGRMLFYDPRFSVNQEISCNTCHQLDSFGVDNEPTSPGHTGERGERNSPTVYNAALHVAQFWDGRAADVEEQAKGPVLNPVEMGMPSAEHVVEVLRSIPGYRERFAEAFPGQEDPVDYDNFARAIGAFERGLLTPSPFDAFLEGRTDALGPKQLAGLETFMDTGCIACHNGVGVGGGLYQKLGLVHPYATEDEGRFEVTGDEADRYFFKVPSLRNVVATGPWFHDGQVAELDEAVRLMAWHQLGKELTPEQVAEIVAFLGALTGKPDPQYVAKPELPESGPDTPGPKTAGS